jgi:hypothetical protein
LIDEPPWPFLLLPRQHRHWARIARQKGRPDLAFHHEQLARVIENISQRRTASASDSEAEPPAR